MNIEEFIEKWGASMGHGFTDEELSADLDSLSLPPAEGAEAIHGNSFHLTWKDAQKYPPKEGGRYWCVVREVNDLGISYYQWNCAYNPNDTSRWKDNFVSQDVIWWTELPPMPNLQRQQQPTAEGAEEILADELNLDRLSPLQYNGIIRAMNKFATLHAQRLAEKMVSERLREELIAYKTYENIFDNKFTAVEDLIDEYLKTRE